MHRLRKESHKYTQNYTQIMWFARGGNKSERKNTRLLWIACNFERNTTFPWTGFSKPRKIAYKSDLIFRNTRKNAYKKSAALTQAGCGLRPKAYRTKRTLGLRPYREKWSPKWTPNLVKWVSIFSVSLILLWTTAPRLGNGTGSA